MDHDKCGLYDEFRNISIELCDGDPTLSRIEIVATLARAKDLAEALGSAETSD